MLGVLVRITNIFEFLFAYIQSCFVILICSQTISLPLTRTHRTLLLDGKYQE